MAQGHGVQRLPTPCAQGGVEFDGACNLPWRHQVLDVLHHGVGEEFPGQRKQVTHFGGDDDRAQRQVSLQRKVFQHHDGHGTRVQELMLEFGHGVLRIDVHHHHPRAQNAKQRHGVLQQVGHHEGDPVAPAQAQRLLQVGGEVAARSFEFGIAHRRAHVAVGRQVVEPLAAREQHVGQ